MGGAEFLFFIKISKSFAPAGATRAFRSPWTFGNILFWKLRESSRGVVRLLPSLGREGQGRVLTPKSQSLSKRVQRRRVQRRSESLWPRPQARNLSPVAPACWGDVAQRQRGRLLLKNHSLQKSAPEESRGDRKASGRARRRGIPLWISRHSSEKSIKSSLLFLIKLSSNFVLFLKQAIRDCAMMILPRGQRGARKHGKLYDRRSGVCTPPRRHQL